MGRVIVPDEAASTECHLQSRSGITHAAGALALLASSVLARLPLAMCSIALLLHTRQLTGSFAAAGMVSGAYAAALGVGAPLLGRAVDRAGQTAVLVAGATASALLLGLVAVLPSTVPVAVLVLLAVGIGLATPPLGACTRTLLPALLDPESLRSAYALESSALELTFIFGPPLALGIGAVTSTGLALAAAGLLLLLATLVFALQPASRNWRQDRIEQERRPSSLRSAGLRTLVLVLAAVGVVFGAVDVGVVAAAHTLGDTTTAGPLLAVWGSGSLAGGIAAARLGGGARSARGLALVVAALATGHLALEAAFTNAFTLGAMLFIAGAAIAPTYATAYSMVDSVAPAGTVTEAFAWLSTAIAVGTATGAALAGLLAQNAGAGATFLLAGGAGAAAVLAVVARAKTLLPDGLDSHDQPPNDQGAFDEHAHHPHAFTDPGSRRWRLAS